MFNRKIAKLRSALKRDTSKDAKIIVFEGADRRGKQTQSRMLFTTLHMNGYKTSLVEIPYDDGFTSKIVYSMLSNGLTKMFPLAFQVLQFLNKRLFQALKLKALLRNNDYVIFDRWALSSVIYGNASGVNKTFNSFLYNCLQKPTVTVVIDGNMLATAEDEYEKNSEFQSIVANGYISWAQETKESVVVVSNVNASKMHMHREVIKKLRQLNIV